ncbi:MAG: hypothetical protein BGO88_06800 [Flavobacterium sp. 38-13]|nr:hypothetical protein ASG38_12575 [Flavobacterium sp. Leaf359]OJX50902.1 MAG: hypothetical protein BGO88_06800 [Flavobacterium sp. 38-13]PZO33368.1 MAG: hypothetical protein DCE86_04810 [Flavobacteriaceae bacterium]
MKPLLFPRELFCQLNMLLYLCIQNREEEKFVLIATSDAVKTDIIKMLKQKPFFSLSLQFFRFLKT